MTGFDVLGPSPSLRERVSSLEKQIVQRHHRVQTGVADIKRKITTRLVSPGALLTAAGIGVVMEQTSHHRGWPLATLLNTASASIRLWLSLSSPLPSPVESDTGNTTKEATHEFTRR